MPPGGGTPRTRAPRGAVERQVLDGLEDLLAAGASFTSLGVGQIADHAGVARSSFYLHFSDKNQLLIRIAEAATNPLLDIAEDWITDRSADIETLRPTIREMVAENRKHAHLLAALAEVAAYDAEVAEFWQSRLQGYIDLVEERLQADKRSGLAPAALDPAVTASFIVWGTERVVSLGVAGDPSAAGDRRLADGVADSIWRLMRTAP